MFFFENESSYLILFDALSQHGYVAIGSKEELIFTSPTDVNWNKMDAFISLDNQWKFGFISYELKNNIEDLTSNNKDNLNFPILHFFVPETLIQIKNNEVQLIYGNHKFVAEVENFLSYSPSSNNQLNKLIASHNKEEYIHKVENILNNINLGNIYEANFCYEFYTENADVSPIDLFKRLQELTNAPFSTLGKFEQRYIIGASPERFLSKTGNTLISQPIKGTSARDKNTAKDEYLKYKLKNSTKERSENIMIVDLVRNDFSRIAIPATVSVPELCKIYTFDSVHQMISTVKCEIPETVSFSDILKATFPMGSMTGAPKVSAMQITEKEESTMRGLYSGSVGYIKPNGDFDFNVVIRSFLYNRETRYLSAMVGGAITAQSSPEEEYEETLVKIQALQKAI